VREKGLRRLCAQILVFLALLALGALALIPIWRASVAGMESVRFGLVARLEELLGREIRYSSISPSIFGAFDIRGVSVAAPGEEPVLTVARFRVSYSFPDLVFGRTLAIRSVRLDAPAVSFDAERDADIIALIRSAAAAGEARGEQGGGSGGRQRRRGLAAALPQSASAQVRGGSLSVTGGGAGFRLDSLNAALSVEDARVALDARWNVGLSAPAIGAAPPASVRLAMRLRGEGCADSGEGSGLFSIPYVAGDAESLAPLALDLAFSGGAVSMAKEPGRLPLGAGFRYSFADGSMDARIEAGGFRLGDAVALSGGLEPFRQALDMALSGEAWLRRGADGSLEYAASVSGGALAAGQAGAEGRAGASLEIRASGCREELLVHALRLSLPDAGDPEARFVGSLSFSGGAGLSPFAPSGSLSLGGFGAGRMGKISADADVRAEGGEIFLSARNLRIGEAGPAALGASLRRVDGNAAFGASLEWLGHAAGGGPRPSALLQGYIGAGPRQVDATLVVDSFPLAAMAKMALPRGASLPAPAAAALGASALSAEAFLFTDFERLWHSAPSVSISGGGLEGEISFSGTEGSLELGRSRLAWGGGEAFLSGSAEFGSPGAAGFRLDAEIGGEAHFVEGEIERGRSAELRGSGGLRAGLSAPRGGGPMSGRVSADSLPLPFLGSRARLAVDARLGGAGPGGAWRLDVARLEASGIDGPAGPARLAISGSASAAGAEIASLVYEDAVGPLSGSASASMGPGGFEARLSAFGGAEAYSARARMEGGALELYLSGSSARLYRFSRRGPRGAVADGSVSLSRGAGPGAPFAAELDLQSLRGRLGASEFGASARASLDGDGIAVWGLSASAAGLSVRASELAVSRAEGSARGSLEFGGLFAGRPVSGAAELGAGFEPPGSWAGIGAALESFSASASVAGFSHAGGEPQDFGFSFSREGRAMAASGGPRGMLRFRMDEDENFLLALSSPFPVRGSVIGSVRGGQIDARCNDLFVDLGGLFAVLPAIGQQPARQFSISDGYVTASLDIRGTLRDPEFYGQARVTSSRMHVPFVARPLRPVPFTAVFDGDEIRFGPVPTAVGGGAGLVSANFRFERWAPRNFDISVAVPRETPIPFAMNLTGFTARGDAAGTFALSMENRFLDLSGSLWANNAELGVDTDEIGGGAEPFADARLPFALAMDITSGPIVEFFYPTPQFPIVRATPEMGTRIYITADSLARRYSVTSDVGIRRGEIFYFQRSFYIRSGRLLFQESERGFDPLLTTRAEIRDRTPDGPVTISMVVDNAPLTTFAARFEASPPLSQVEIFTLLGQNLAGGSHFAGAEDPDPMRAFLVSSTDLLAQFTVVRALEQQIRSFTRLDMFSVRTQALQNAFFMAAGVMQPHEGAPGSRLGSYFDNTTIFGGKYVGQSMFVQGMLSMRRDGIAGAGGGGLALQPDIGIDFQGPMINNYNLRIRWDLVPASPENWFVNDNSITLTFSRLF